MKGVFALFLVCLIHAPEHVLAVPSVRKTAVATVGANGDVELDPPMDDYEYIDDSAEGGDGRTCENTSCIPLNVVSFRGGLGLAVHVKPAGEPSQQVLLHMRNSMLAFCNSTLGGNANKTLYKACNMHKNNVSRPGYNGSIYQGQLVTAGRITVNGFYAVMDQQRDMPCSDGLQGIYGVAFKASDNIVKASGTLTGSCSGTPTKEVPSALDQIFDQHRGHEQRVGIYWSGLNGTGEGNLFINDYAINNSLYKAEPGQITPLGSSYDIDILKFSFQSDKTEPVAIDVSCNGTCILDIGTPSLTVPPTLYAAILKATKASGEYDIGPFKIYLGGSSGVPVVLEFDAKKMLEKGWLSASQGPFILGLPLWSAYYTVFSIDNSTVEFIRNVAGSWGDGGPTPSPPTPPPAGAFHTHAPLMIFFCLALMNWDKIHQRP